MTLDDYAKTIALKLVAAHNGKNLSTADAVFREADAELTRSNISKSNQKVFWSNVKARFSSGQLLLERQANSSLLALMQAIQDALAVRENK